MLNLIQPVFRAFIDLLSMAIILLFIGFGKIPNESFIFSEAEEEK